MQAISSYLRNIPTNTHKHTNKQTGVIAAPQLSAQCKNEARTIQRYMYKLKNAKKTTTKLSCDKRTSSRVNVYIISIVGKPTENIQHAS